MEEIILFDNFIVASRKELVEINFLLDLSNEDANCKSFEQDMQENTENNI